MSTRASKSNQQDKFHIQLKFSVMDSPAWESLDNHARVVYLYFIRREMVNRWKGKNPKCKDPWRPEVSLSYREMEKVVNPHQFHRAINSLCDRGFIIKRQEGGLYRKRNWYLLSGAWKIWKQGDSPVKDRWNTNIKAVNLTVSESFKSRLGAVNLTA